jgi:hypothetical protein
MAKQLAGFTLSSGCCIMIVAANLLAGGFTTQYVLQTWLPLIVSQCGRRTVLAVRDSGTIPRRVHGACGHRYVVAPLDRGGMNLPPEPKCPACGAGVDRPKCLFEMGGDCPRHEVRNAWKRQINKILAAERSSGAGDVPMEAMND